MHRGYLKLWRRIEDAAIFTNSQAVHIFIFLLVNAARFDRCQVIGNQKIELKMGQVATGRKAISSATGINESKVYRIIELLKSEQLIEQQANSKFSIISICNWSQYQNVEQQSEQQPNNNRTASEQQVNTNKNLENLEKLNNGKKKETILSCFEEVWAQYPERDGNKKKAQEKITKQLMNGRTEDDLRLAISNYLEHVRLKRENGFRELRYQNRQTWFNNWEQWIEWEKPKPDPFQQPKNDGPIYKPAPDLRAK